MSRHYNIGNKDKVSFELFYHKINMFINTMGCGCDYCMRNGNRIDCTDEINRLIITEIKETDMDAFKDIEVNCLIIIHEPKCNIDALLNNPKIKNIKISNKSVK